MHNLALKLTTLLVAFTLGTALDAAAQKKGVRATDTSIQGNIGTVDSAAKTITIKGRQGERTVIVDSTTIITKDGKVADFADIKTGAEATVSTFMAGEKLTAVTVKLGSPTAAAGAAGTSDTVPKKKKKKNTN
jgi:hypothetical protein